jgi:cytoskeletal protein CcmA (bactofilin family)
MISAIRRRTGRADRERGSALIAAIAVALIGIALATVVVSASISLAQESGVDRARTSGVHTAEGAIDATYAELETWTPCQWPAGAPAAGSTSPATTSVRATVAYYTAAGAALTCSGGVLSGVPATAVITATATAGTVVERTVQSKVSLRPVTLSGRGAAIFAANSIMTTNSFTVSTIQPDTQVDVWVDSGNVDCNSGVTIDGNLIVVNGGVSTSGQCQVTGNVWSKNAVQIVANPPGGKPAVGGSLWATGNIALQGGTRIGGDVVSTGSVTQWSPAVIGGAVRQNVAPSNIPTYTRKQLPEVLYRPADWSGFVIAGDRQDAYRQWVRQEAANNNAPSWADSRNTTKDQCKVAGASYDANGPLVGPTTATLFDTRNCATTQFENGLNIQLRADMVIFANSFYSTGNFRVTSYDGAQHQFWIIVADKTPNGVAECAGGVGNIKGDSGSVAVRPITIFMYTPCTIDLNNSTDLYGQLYGGRVELRNPLTVSYVPIGIPGVTMPSTAPEGSAGYRVDVVYKREIKNP